MESKPFDQGNIVSTKDLGFEDDFMIYLERSFEGGWTARDPESGYSELGETKEEAVQHLLDNLRLHHRQKYKL